MSQSDRRRELAEALQEVAEAQRADADEARRRQKARRPEGTRPATIAVGLAAAGLLAWIWVARPAAVFAPGTPAPLSPAAAEERARVALYLERSRIEDYRRTRGRLPTSLADAGAVETGVSYRRADTGYLLEATPGRITLQLTDRMNSDSFLGEAATVGGARRP